MYPEEEVLSAAIELVAKLAANYCTPAFMPLAIRSKRSTEKTGSLAWSWNIVLNEVCFKNKKWSQCDAGVTIFPTATPLQHYRWRVQTSHERKLLVR